MVSRLVRARTLTSRKKKGSGNMDSKTAGQVRHFLTAVGGVLTAVGFTDAVTVASWIDTAMQLVGPGMIIWGMIWSYIAPEKNA